MIIMSVFTSDEINALLNYGYAILESEIRKSINVIRLDYSVGFLHEPIKSKIGEFWTVI